MDKQRKKELLQQYKEQPLSGGAYMITNTATGKKMLVCETNLRGSKQRFDFARQTKTNLSWRLQKDWEQYGPEVFTFTLLEEIEMQPTQTKEDFAKDLELLHEIWLEKLSGEDLY